MRISRAKTFTSLSFVCALIPLAITTITTIMLWWLTISGDWKMFGIWTEPSVIGWTTGFTDLAYITATADCMAAGTDIVTCDPYGRPFTPYTVIPSIVFATLGLGLQHTS